MWHITSTEIIDSELEAIEIISEMSCIKAGEEVEITDFNGKTYNFRKTNNQIKKNNQNQTKEKQ
jgi:hypothetical protein